MCDRRKEGRKAERQKGSRAKAGRQEGRKAGRQEGRKAGRQEGSCHRGVTFVAFNLRMPDATTSAVDAATARGSVRSISVVVALGVVALFGFYCATHSVDFPVYHRTARQIIAGSYDIYPKPTVAGGPLPAH